MADYNISVDTNIDTGKLDAFEKKINSLENKTLDIKVNVDASDISKQVTSQINKALGVGSSKKATVKLDVDVNTSGVVKKANDAFKNIKNQTLEVSTQIGSGKEYRDNIREINNAIKEINRLSINPDVNVGQLKELEQYLDKLITRKKIADSNEIDIFDGLDVTAAREFAIELEKVDHQLSMIQKKNGDIGQNNAIKQQASETKTAMNELASAYKRMDSLQKQQVGLDVNSNQYKAIDNEINRLIQKAVELQTKLGNNIPDGFFDSIAESGARARADLDKTIAKVEDARRKMADAFAGKINNGTLDGGFEQLTARIDKIANKTPELTKAYEQLKNLRSEFGNVSTKYQQTGNIDELLSFQNKYNEALTVTQNRLKANESMQQRVNREIKNQTDLTKLESSKKTFDLQIQSWLKNNSAAAIDFGDKLENIRARIQQCNDSASLNNLKSEFQQVKLEAQIADKATMTFGDRLKNQFRQYASYVGIAGVFMQGSQAVRMMAQNVLEVDTAMTGLYRVTDLTSAQYDKLYSDMIASSKEYGTTLTDTINATADWVRAGYDADTSLQLADITAMYQHISDLDYAEASKNLLTAYNGFKDTFNQDFGEGNVVASVNHIADAFNELDNKYSITSAGLGEGLARSASALELAGNTFEEAAAMIGAAGEVTQDPTRVGTAMRTLSLRIRGELYNTPPYSESYKLCCIA